MTIDLLEHRPRPKVILGGTNPLTLSSDDPLNKINDDLGPPALALAGAEVYSAPGPGQCVGPIETDQKDLDKSALYAANVQSRSTSLTFKIPGWNLEPSLSTCGKIISKTVCCTNENHNPIYKHEYCNDPFCRTCYTKFVNRMAKGIVKRVLGFLSPRCYPNARLDHVVIWGKFGVQYDSVKHAFADAKRMVKRLGIVAAAVIYHPYRIKKELKEQLRGYKIQNGLSQSVGFWRLAHDDVLGLGSIRDYVIPGPHFHVISQGYLPDNLEYIASTGCGYKKVRQLTKINLDDTELEVSRLCNYLCSHTAIEGHSQFVRYLGNMRNNHLGCYLDKVIIEDVVCVKCGAPLSEYSYNDSTDRFDILKHENVTQKTEIYIYYIKSKKPKALAKLGAYQDTLLGCS